MRKLIAFFVLGPVEIHSGPGNDTITASGNDDLVFGDGGVTKS